MDLSTKLYLYHITPRLRSSLYKDRELRDIFYAKDVIDLIGIMGNAEIKFNEAVEYIPGLCDSPYGFIIAQQYIMQYKNIFTSALESHFNWLNFFEYNYVKTEKQSKLDEWYKSWEVSSKKWISKNLKKSLFISSVAIEITDGCSVGCSYCCLDAKKLNGIYDVNEANMKLFSDILKTLHEFLGGRICTGILYWATDPIDHPRYVEFHDSFKSICGMYPSFSTSKYSTENLQINAILERAYHSIKPGVQLSILNIEQGLNVLKDINQEYRSIIKVVPQNKESSTPKVISGRYRKLFFSSNKVRDNEIYCRQLSSSSDNWETLITKNKYGETNSCLLGFIINMPRKEVFLVSPCPATASSPKGYKTHDMFSFSNQEDFQAKLSGIGSNLNMFNEF